MVQGDIEVQPETLRRAEIWLQSQPLEAVHRTYITDLANSFGETMQDKLTIGFLRAAIKAAAPSLGYVDKLCPSTNKRMLVKVSLPHTPNRPLEPASAKPSWVCRCRSRWPRCRLRCRPGGRNRSTK